MNKSQSNASILDYWRAVEFFSPQKLPDVDPKDKTFPVFSIKDNDLMPPWDSKHPMCRRLLENGATWRYIVYAGVYQLETAKSILEPIIGKDPESFDDRQGAESCLFAFMATPDGRPLFETFTVSTCAWAISRTISVGPSSSQWLEGFEETADHFSKHFDAELAYPPEDEEGKRITGLGFSVGRPLNSTDIQQQILNMCKGLGLHDLITTVEIRVKCIQAGQGKHYSSDDNDFLNSFFLNDLKRISGEARSGNIGAALNHYLTEENQLGITNRVDIRNSPNHLFHQLEPNAFPQGRWPSVDHHPLVFSQQFAINALSRQFGASKLGGMFAVNGPPGTGKTTLLRDLIAANLVDRAKQLAQLKRSADAFVGTRKWKSEKYNRIISMWSDAFAGFEIVVASYNNGAVENVTMEIPGKSSIDPSWMADTDYFPDFAEAITGKPAWGLLAAKLGNKTNRNDFLSRFWYDDQSKSNQSGVLKSEQDNLDKKAGFQTWLGNQKSEAIDWAASVKRFRTAIQHEEKLRAQRQLAFQLILELDRLRVSIAQLEQQIQGLIKEFDIREEEYKQWMAKVDTALKDLETSKAKRFEHHQFRPRILDIIMTLGRAYRDWSKKDRILESAIENQDQSYREDQRSCKKAKDITHKISNQLDALTEQRNTLQAQFRSKENILSAEKERLGFAFPDTSTWKDDKVRELSSPWADPEWNKARAQVFLEALHLHRAFIIENADALRKNLQGMSDVLSGSVPPNAAKEAVEAAWRTLFFVIPVISSTFASYDRLFSHLGKESIGWLLIDEAGQASPQTAVGAIWRAKRVVVVGDPLQLEPVLTVPYTVQQSLRTFYKVAETWLPQNNSTQRLADRIAKFGTSLETSDKQNLWVGAPLRVHRRCDKRMFDISNKIAYNGMMVFGTNKRAALPIKESCWIDVVGEEANGHWIPAEGEAVTSLIEQIAASGSEDIFLISPFTTVVQELRLLAKRHGTRGIRAGTIHTVQGKEAD
ncbi:MAG: AAA domain-containing protein, partial [Limisphaerales bacterium]